MTADTRQRAAVLGLGVMGAGMAKNLLRAGFQVSVYNRSPGKAAALQEQGAKVAKTPREAAEGADVIVSMVADDSAARSVWLGPDGALAGASAGAVIVEASTITVGWMRELAEAATKQGLHPLDAPVTGTKIHAENGELLFLVGGSSEGLEKARPALAAMSREIIHVGPSGSGSMLKLINNFLCGVQVASIGEAIGWLERTGLDRAKALEVLTGGAPGSPLVKTIVARVTAAEETVHFASELMAKDLQYANLEGEHHGVPLRTAVAAREVFLSAVDEGLGERDISAIVEQFRQEATSGRN